MSQDSSKTFRTPPENAEIVSFRKSFDDDEFESFDIVRYIIINADTGEVFDDAHGYGYRSKRKAITALSYMRARAAGKPTREDLVREWCKANEDACHALQSYIDSNRQKIQVFRLTDKDIFRLALKDVEHDPLPKGVGPKSFMKYWPRVRLKS